MSCPVISLSGIALLLLGLIIADVPCAQAQITRVWVADAMEKVQPYDAAQGTTSISLAAAKNEYAPAQIVVSGEQTSINSMTVSASDLTGPAGTISAGNYQFYKEHYMYITKASDNQSIGQPGGAPVFVPDALVPLDRNVPPTYNPDNPASMVLALNSVYNKVFWADLFIPATAAAGDYTGTITVSVNGSNYTVSVSLRVWDVTIPSQNSLEVAVRFRPDFASVGHGFGWTDTQNFAQKYSQLALEHRIYFWRAHENSWLPFTYNDGGTASNPADDSISIDWTEFDTRVGPMLDGTLGTKNTYFNAYALYSPQSITGTAQLRNMTYPLSALNEMKLVLFWRAMADHFRQKGWFDQLMFYNVDEPTTAMYPKTLYLSTLMFYADPDVPVMVTEDYNAALDTAITIDPADPKFNSQTGFYDNALNPNYNSGNPAYNPSNPGAGKYVKRAIDIWTPVNKKYDWDPSTGRFDNDPDTYSALQAGGSEVWWYLSCQSWACMTTPDNGSDFDIGSYAIDAESVYLRHVFWTARRYHIQGFLAWASVAAFQDTSRDPWINQYSVEAGSGGNGDGNFFYPGRAALTGTYPSHRAVIGGPDHIPVASIRMKIMREGIEDYELLKLVDDAGASAFVDAELAGIVTNTQNWSHNYQDYYTAREALAGRIAASPIDTIAPASPTNFRITSIN